MITAPDVFATDSNGTYTPDVAVDWVAEHGTPSPLYIGRTFRYLPYAGWEFGPAKPGAQEAWKPLSDASKALRSAFGDLEDLPDTAIGFAADEPGHYELIGPKLARNPHSLDQPRLVRHGWISDDEAPDFASVPTTSLWALVRNWFPDRDHQGILWTWDDGTSDWPRFAAVRRDRLPAV